MNISSRTPEGLPNRCVMCGNELCIEPSPGTLDAPCPFCGHLLWFSVANGHRSLASLPPTSFEAYLMRVGTECLGPIPGELLQALIIALDEVRLLRNQPNEDQLKAVVFNSSNWQQVVWHLNRWTFLSSKKSRSYRAGAYLRKTFKRLVQKLAFAK